MKNLELKKTLLNPKASNKMEYMLKKLHYLNKVISNKMFRKMNTQTSTKIKSLRILTLVNIILIMSYAGLYSQVDLAVSKSASITTAEVGDPVTFTVDIVNEGTADANNVVVSDAIPAGTTFSASGGSGTYDDVLGEWTIPSIAAGTTESFTVTVTINSDGIIYNLAEVASMDESDADSTPGNGDHFEDDISSACVSVPIRICSELNETIEVDVPIAGLENVQWFRDIGNGPVPVGVDSVLTITEAGEYTFSSTQGSACESGICCPIIVEDACFDLGLRKVLAAGQSSQVTPGSDVNFTIEIHNQGDLAADNILVTDYIPSGFTLNDTDWNSVSATEANILLSVANGNLMAGGLAAGTTMTVDITLTVDPTATGGSNLTNFAEISGATDDDGGAVTDVDSSPDNDPSNDIFSVDDSVLGDGTTGGDEDDHDPASVVVSTYDVALMKTVNTTLTDSPLYPGGTVWFDIEVFNQGTTDVFDIVVTDYLPTGLTLVTGAGAADWTETVAGVAAVYNSTIDLAAGTSQVIAIPFTVDPNAPTGVNIDNFAEISEAFTEDGGSVPILDEDSTLDDNPNNDGTVSDNDINDVPDNPADEDDHDVAPVVVEVFDLALVKTVNSSTPGPYDPGSTITFDLTVHNQGTVDAYDVEVNDYFPINAGFVLADADWAISGSTATMATAILLNEIPFIAAGDNEVITITFTIDANFQGSALTNNAEIASASDTDGGPNVPDVDSTPGDQDGTTPDSMNDDTADDMGGDDYDPETIMIGQVFDLALTKEYKDYNDVDMDGMISAGDYVTYTITVYNQGTLDAFNVTVADYAPTDLNYLAASAINTAAPWVAGTNPSHTIATLAAGNSVAVDIEYEIDPLFQGTSLINDAEIVAADDDMDPNNTPPVDEDSVPGDDSGNPSETATDNDIADNSTGGMDNPADSDDFDPAEIMIGQVFDLALAKTINAAGTDSPLNPGGTVTFDINVSNQGSLDAYNIQISDYIPTGLTLADTDWTDNSGVATLNSLIATLPANGMPVVVPITFTVDATFQGSSITNHAEISSADDDTDPNNTPPTDIDSTPDGANDDVIGGNDVTDNSNADEDDHDPETVMIGQSFDLALTKTLNSSTPGPFTPGSTVTFDITVYNQGTVDAYDIQLNDYIPAGLTLADAQWSMSAGVATLLNEIPFVAAGDNEVVTISFTIDNTFQGSSITNNSEIASADDDTNPNNTPPVDEDSTPNDNSGTPSETGTNDELSDDSTGGADDPNDHDDYDPETILINHTFDLALNKVYTSFTDMDGDMAVSPNDLVTFTITVYNQGSLDAYNVVVADYVRAGLIYEVGSAVNTGAPWDNSGTDPAHTFANIPAGGSASVDIELRVDPNFQGTSVINDAEITEADDDTDPNNTPPVDEDSVPGDDSANPSELGTDNELADDSTGGMDNPADSDDYDPAEVPIGQVFDLALTKTFNAGLSDSPVVPGSTLVFDLNVTNQGSLDAYNIQISDYIPAGLTLTDVNWTDNSGVATLNTLIPTLPAGGVPVTVTISFMVDATFQGSSITNVAEISSADDDTDPNNTPPTDIDSTTDGSNDDVIGGDNLDNNSNGDEDDHDPETVMIGQSFDLALIKTLNATSTGPFTPGSTVTFDINVVNQGTLDAYDIQVNDYTPAGMTLADAQWTLAGTTASLLNEIPFIAAGDNEIVTISFTIDPDFTGASLTNNAEIAAADDDTDPNNAPPVDEDSTPNDNSGTPAETGTNDELSDDSTGGADDPNDHDDYDPETIMVTQEFDLAITKVYTTHSDDDMDGGISAGDDVTFTITIYNQGTLEGTDIDVMDYVPTGMTFVSLQSGVVSTTLGNTATITDNGGGSSTVDALAGSDAVSYTITLEIDPTFQGTTLTNNVEIVDASNALGLDDEDSGDFAANANGSADDESEMVSDNDIDDENPDQPGTEDNVGDEDDYDPAQITVGQVFDLALIKTVNSGTAMPIVPGATVVFDVTVSNQGTVDAYNIQLSDYIPTGLTLIDPAWTDIAGTATLNSLITFLGAQDNITVPISFMVDPTFGGTSITNMAEISSADDDNDSTNTPPTDVDSTPDGSNDDVIGGNDIDDNTNADEDDHDPETIMIDQVFDLALNKTTASGAVSPGGDAYFTFEVFNQGTLTAYDIEVVDYVPTGLIFDPGHPVNAIIGWLPITGGNAMTTIDGPIPPGGSETVTIVLTVDPTFIGTSINNFGEIAAADDDTNPANTPPTDADSTPDTNDGNDGPVEDDEVDGLNGDEDDHDVAPLMIDPTYDVALMKTLATGQSPDAAPGDNVVFTVTVFNQGQGILDNITITDYVPAGMTLNDANWTSVSATEATATLSAGVGLPAGGLMPGDNASYNIILQLDNPLPAGSTLTNWAEVSGMTDTDGNAVTDVDSTPDNNDANDNFIGDDDVSGNGIAGGDEDDHDPAEVTVLGFDLALKKTLAVGQASNVGPGDLVTYTIEVVNQGDITADNITVMDYIPTGLSLADTDWTAVGSDASIALSAANTGLPAGGLPPAGVVTVDITLQVDSPINAGLTLTNWAEIAEATDDNGVVQDDVDSTPDSDPNNDNFLTDNDQSGDSTIGGDEDDHDPAEVVTEVFDLALRKSISSNAAIQPGGDVTFTITVFNQGSIIAQNVDVIDYIPAGFTLSPLDANGWTVVGTNASNTIAGPIAPFGSAGVDIVLRADPALMSGSFVNHAEITGSEDNTGTDRTNDDIDSTADADDSNDPEVNDEIMDDGTNDEDDADMEVVNVAVFDLALRKVALTTTPIMQGADVTFQIEVFNQGAIPATDIDVVDYIPTGFALSALDLNGWLPSGPNMVTNNISTTILPGDSETLEIVLTMQPGASLADLENNAEITGAEDDNGNIQDGNDVDSTPDNTLGNDNEEDDMITDGGAVDEDDHDIAEPPVFDLALRKTTAQVDPVTVGDDVTFTIEVFNQGNIVADNVEIIDYIPSGFVLSPADGNGWLAAGANATNTVGPIAGGASLPIDIVLRVAPTAAGGDFNNWSEITGAEDDNGADMTNADWDSTPDTDPDNDLYVGDDINDDGTNDEDDHDDAPVTVEIYDLALRKTLVTTTPITIDADVTFNIEVFNQGSVDMQNIKVTDFLAQGFQLSLNDTNGWAYGLDGSVNVTVPGPLAPGASVNIPITLTTTSGIDVDNTTNFAEICSMEDYAGNDRSNQDLDSNPDTDDSDDLIVNDEINDDGTSDEDDHDIEEVNIFDLALMKTTTQVDPVTVGDDVLFTIEVFNQGNVTAQNIEITEFIPSGFVLSPNDMNGWAPVGTNAITVINGPIVGGNSTTVDILLRVDVSAVAGGSTNIAEITGSQDIDGNDTTDADFDSTADDDPSNDNLVDDETNDGGIFDEDDNDIAEVVVEIVDLALMKVVAPTQVTPINIGDDVTYIITVFNQGSIDLQNIEISDFIPAGMALSTNDTNGWVDNLDNTASVTVAGPIAVNGFENVEIVLTVQPDVPSGDVTNFAEIASMEDLTGTDRSDDDADSTPDDDPTNDPLVDDDTTCSCPEDEDDNDSASISVCTDVIVSSDVALCLGESTQLVATLDEDNVTFSWAPTIGLSCTDCPNPIAQPNTTTNYVVTASYGGCESSATVTVTVAPSPSLVLHEVHETCCDGGSIVASANGGTGDYIYEWDPNVSDNREAFDLAAGTYTVTVTDEAGCTAMESVVIQDACTDCSGLIEEETITIGINDQPLTVCATFDLTDADLYNYILDGSTYEEPAVVCSFDSILFYTYALLVGQGSSGPYSIDSWTCGDGQTYSWVVADMDELVANMNSVDPTGNWVNNTTTFTISGGDPNNTYANIIVTHVPTNVEATIQTNWTQFASGSAFELPPLTVGTHTFTIEDPDACCTDVVTIIVEDQCLGLEVVITGTNADCCNVGSATASATGGDGNYTYLWSDGSKAGSLTDAMAGTYDVTVMDGSGCEGTAQVTLVKDCDCDADALIDPTEVAINLGESVDVCVNVPTTEINIYDILLNGSDYTQPAVPCNGDSVIFYTYALLVNLGQDGPYEVIWTGADFQVYTWVVQDMDELVTNMQNVDPAGNWMNNPASFTISGGHPSGSYSNMEVTYLPTFIHATIMTNFTGVAFGSGFEVTPTTPGQHIFSVIDPDNCCEDQLIINVIDPCGNMDYTISGDVSICPGEFVNLTVNGGFTYAWDTGATTATLTVNPTITTTYSVTITDVDGCTAEEQVTVNVSDALQLNMTVANMNCCGGGSAFVSVQGGSGSYTYTWSDPTLSGNNPNGLAAGTYFVTVTDGGGCEAATSFVVVDECACPDYIVETDLTAQAGDVVTVCAAFPMTQAGDYTITINGQPYAGGISTCTAGTELTFDTSVGGTYILNIYNNVECCEDQVTLVVEEACSVQLSLTVTDAVDCCNNGSATVFATGPGNITYSWSTGDTGTFLGDLDAGTYTVTALSDEGCEATETFTISDVCTGCPDIMDIDFVSIPAGEATEYCLPASYATVRNIYDVLLDGSLYVGPLDKCDIDSIIFYTYALTVGLGQDGPYELLEWEVGGTVYTGVFQTMDDLVAQMNIWNPTGMWVNNATSFTISGGDDFSGYGDMLMRHLASGVDAVIQTNVTHFGNGTKVDVPDEPGTYVFELFDPLTCCSDAITIVVEGPDGGPTPDFVNLETNVNVPINDICVDLSELTATPVTMELCSDPSNGTVNLDGPVQCVTYIPNSDFVGMDEFCLVICDELGVCDTTYVNVTVNDNSTVGEIDTVELTIPWNEQTGYLCTPWLKFFEDDFASLSVCGFPENITLLYEEDEDCFMLNPDPDFCGMDEFCVIVCDDEGVCGTVVYLIDVTCGGVTNPTPDTVFVNLTPNIPLQNACASLNEINGFESITSCGDPANGTLSFEVGAPCVDYVPNTDYCGPDEFCIEVCDMDGNCDQTFFIISMDNCPDCEPTVEDAIVTVDDCDSDGEFCFTMALDELVNFSITNNGQVYDNGFSGCDFVDRSSYTYFTFPGGGEVGPYELTSWMVNGVPNTGTFNNIAELVDLMNALDPNGNWTVEPASLLIIGGDSANTYGLMSVLQTMSNGTAEVEPSVRPEPNGVAINLPVGDNMVVLTHNSGCPILQFNVTVECGDPCPEFDQTIDIVAGESLVLCPVDLGIRGTVLSAMNTCMQNAGTASAISLDATTSCITIEALAEGTETACIEYQMDSGCQVINFTINVTPDVDCPPIFTNDEITEASTLACDGGVDVCVGLDFAASLNYTIAVNGVEYTTPLTACTDGILMTLPEGSNEVLFTHDVTSCEYTLFADVICLSPDIMTDTIFVNSADTTCIDLSELPGNPTTMTNACGAESGTFVGFSLIEESYCVVYEGTDIGQESACIVVCDDLGFCDTTFVIVTVVPRESVPNAEPDEETTLINTDITINVLVNDTIKGGADTIYIAQDPVNGEVTINDDMTITYSPDQGYCNSNIPDDFIYIICNETGCDSALVQVFVLCDEVVIHTGFSPNGDGINDFFTIDNVEAFPDSELAIFNRWGNRVFNTKNYRNDWDGSWNGEALPDGTYFYVFDDGQGNLYSGYVQIHR